MVVSGQKKIDASSITITQYYMVVKNNRPDKNTF